MSESLMHRGPDDFGYLLADTATARSQVAAVPRAPFVPDLLLASRRLSILDLSPAGRQPISNETDDIFVVFNGAIHNYIELRKELEGFGHVFRSRTDTEVIVHAYEQWGIECASRFNGMWAYAIWDVRHQRLICSRDRFGIKPFVVARDGDAFYFASEAKAIFAAGVPAVPNVDFVCSYLSGSIPALGDQTAFADVHQVPAGHNLLVTRSGEHLSRYWSYTDQSESYDYRHPEQTFRALLADAVSLRLRSDVPIAVLLSGGLDSSAVASLSAQQKIDGFEAFTVAFPGYTKDESRYAEVAARHCGLPHSVVTYDPAHLLDDLDSVTWAMDSPPPRGQLVARWRVLKAVAEKARIVLEGQGADEILGGYPDRYLKPYMRSEIVRLRPWNLYPRLGRIAAARLWRHNLRIPRAERRRFRQMRFDGVAMLAPEIGTLARKNDSSRIESKSPFPDALHEKLWRDHSSDLLPHLLHFGDAISMAHSLESRLPFMDHRIVEFVFGLPFDQIIRGVEAKHVMRRSLAQDLPPEIARRRDKIGFQAPVVDWVRDRLESEIRPRLESAEVRNRGIFDHKQLDECLRQAPTNPICAELLYRCCGLDSWYRQFVDGEGFAALPVGPAGATSKMPAGAA